MTKPAPINSRRIVDIVFALIPILMGWVLFEPLSRWREPRTIYVSKTGSDRYQGTAPDAAVATVQRALDLAIPGDRILIRPGTYHERVHVRHGGRTDAPVIIVAETPGTACITGADPLGLPQEWAWRQEGDGIYSTAIRHPVYRLDHDDATCFRVPWGGLSGLRKLIAKPSAWSAFCTENNRLYLFLKDRSDPADARLKTHRPAPAPREWGEFKSATMWIEADHVVVEGLRIEDGIGAAVTIHHAVDVTLRDCAFSGSTFGVQCSTSENASREIRLVRCLYHNYPQYHWRRDWLTWDEVYASYASSTLIASTTTPLAVENCFVTHAGDALRVSPQLGQSSTAQIEDNFLTFCTDDAIEFDGDGSQVDVTHNLIYECHQNLGFSPVEYGPVTVEENLFAHEPDGINGSQVKLITNRPQERIQNITVRDNVFVGNWLCWWNEAPRQNILFAHNQFHVRQQTDPVWPPNGVHAEENLITVAQTSIRPQQTVRDWYHKAGRPDWVQTLLQKKSGPSWWRAAEHPATRDAIRWRDELQEFISSDAVTEAARDSN